MSGNADKADTDSGDRGVFGNLPSERPGVRSPRREDEKRAPAGTARRTKATASKGAKPSQPPPPPAQPPRPTPPPHQRAPATEHTEPRAKTTAAPESAPSRRGIEDVAWAGVTVAAEAATLGVRLFSRALEAVRERR